LIAERLQADEVEQEKERRQNEEQQRELEATNKRLLIEWKQILKEEQNR